MMICYAGLDNNYGFPLLQKQLKELENEAGHQFPNTQLIPLLKAANTKNYDEVKIMVRTLLPAASAEEMAAHLEDVLRQADIVKEKEEKKKWDIEQQ